MRRPVPLLTAALCMMLAAGAAHALPRSWRVHAYELLLPGTSTRDTAHLDDVFRGKVLAVLERMEARGFHPVVRSAWRSESRQDAIYQVGKLRQQLLGGAPATQARGGRSCHNRRDDDGSPAALAIDVNDADARTPKEKAVFYRALGEEAQAEGLVWGGAWSRKNAVWKRYGLGWDPAHVESRRCTTRR